MTSMRIKLSVGAAVLIAAAAYLAYAGVNSGWVYYVEVDKLLADPAAQHGRVRVCGVVDADGLEMAHGRLGARFNLVGRTGKLPVTYAGVVPDLFKAGCDAVVEGTFTGGVFHADILLTKCASKYKPKDFATTTAPATTDKTNTAAEARP